MDDAERRRLFSVAFEPHGDSYLYYRNRWSGGVPVSASEREVFLSSNPLAAMRLSMIFARRAAVTPPRYASPWMVVDALPRSFALSVLFFAAVAAGEALNLHPFLPKFLLFGLAATCAVAGLFMLFRRRVRSGHDMSRPQ